MWWITTTLGWALASTGRAKYASISSPPWPVMVVVSAMIASDMRGGSDALQDRARTEAAAAAHRDKRVGAIDALELVHRLGDQECARRTERVPDGDGPAVQIHLLVVGIELALPGQHDRRERLVDLGQVHVLHRHAGALEQAVRRIDRAGEHEHRVGPDEARVDDTGAGLETERVGLGAGHDEHRG